MGNKNFRTKGGVTEHAISRLFGQYDCQVSEKNARKILREAKKGENNGHVWVSEEAQKMLRVELPEGNRLVFVVDKGEIVTIEDKVFA